MLFLFCISCASPDKINYGWETDLKLAKKTLLEQEAGFTAEPDKQKKFASAMDKIINNLDEYNNDDEVEIELSKAIATISQSHTRLQIKRQPVLPLKFYIQNGRPFVIAALNDYKNILFAELTKIEETSADKIIQDLSSVIPHDNEQSLNQDMPDYLITPSYLKGLGYISNKNAIKMTFKLVNQQEKEIVISPLEITSSVLKDFAIPYEKELSFQLQKSNYALQYIKQKKTIYLAYNSCEEDPDYPIQQLKSDLKKILKKNSDTYFIIDLRNNGGGDSQVIDPIFKDNFLQTLFKGHTVVLIGRGTASSAIINAMEAKDYLEATLIGEPTGGNPNAPGEVKSTLLQGTNNTISYTTKSWTSTGVNHNSLLPDISISYTVEDYKNATDPILKAAFQKIQNESG